MAKKIPERWTRSSPAVRAVQVAFDVSEDVSRKIRLAACRAGVNPSDKIRDIVGLPVSSKPVRPRLTVSLSEDDYNLLSQRYGLPSSERVKIKRRVMEDLIRYQDNEKSGD